MSNILLAYGNKATGATLSGGGWTTSGLPLNNLKDGRLAKVARSDGASVYQTQFRFDLAANYVLRALALVNHNLTTGALWRARTTDATLDMDFVGPTSMRPRTLTTSGGANGTRVGIYGTIEAATCPRYDFSPVNLASGTATQTISSVPAGTYLLITTGSNAAVMATGSTVSNTGTIGTTTNPSFVVVTATGNVTLTVLSAATAIHFRESLGLLVEEARTNLLTYSDDFTNAAWTKAADGAATIPVVTGNAGTAPDGASTADKVEFVTTAASGDKSYIYATPGLSVGSYAGGVYVKAFAAGDVGKTMTFRHCGGGAFTTVVLSAIWQRVTSVETRAFDYWEIGVSIDGGGSSGAVTALLWRATIEAGSFITSPIGTTSAAVTRTADSVSITGSNFSGFYNQSEGTLYAEARTAVVASTRGMLAASNTLNESINMYRAGSDVYGEIFDGGVLQGTQTVANSGEASKAAIAYKLNDVATAANGAISAVDTSVTIPTPNELQIGNTYGGGAYPLNGHIRRLAYWPTRRTNAELQSITTTGPDALGLDTGWQPAKQMTFHGDTPANWGAQYPLIATFDARTVRYGTIEIDDTTNPATYVQIGQFFPANGFTTETNPTSLGDGRTDLSSSVKSVGGQKYSTARRRPRKVDLGYAVLTEEEGERMDEMMAEIGTTEDVLYVSDPADPAHIQRWSFLGTLQELSPLDYPLFEHRATVVRIEQKL